MRCKVCGILLAGLRWVCLNWPGRLDPITNPETGEVDGFVVRSIISEPLCWTCRTWVDHGVTYQRR